MATKGPINQLDDILELYLVKKAPSLPANAKEALVRFAPWIALIVLIISLPLVLGILGLGALVAPLSMFGGPAYAASYTTSYIISAVILGISILLMALSIPGLFARSMKGWRLAYYGVLVGLISNLISFNIVGGLINALIGFYLLLQIKSYYR